MYPVGIIAASGRGGIVIPPLPSTVGLVGSWGVLGNSNPVGYPTGECVGTESATGNDNTSFTAGSPYPTDWATLISNGDPPYLINTLDDQNSNANDLTASGSARPVLQVATSAVVVGGSQPGTYLYSGQWNGYAYYNLSGHADSHNNYSIGSPDGDGAFTIYGAAASELAISNDDGHAFPSQSNWVDTGSTVTADPNGGGWVQGSATTGMAGAVELFVAGSPTLTLNLLVYISDFSGNSVLFETNTFADRGHTINQISIRMLAGVLTASAYDATAVVAVPNSKVKTLSVAGWYNIVFEVNSALAGTAQTVLKVNDSTSGVTSVGAGNLASANMAQGIPNLMARDAGGTLSLGFPGQFLQGQVYSDVKSASDLTTIFNWLTYAASTQGITIGA